MAKFCRPLRRNTRNRCHNALCANNSKMLRQCNHRQRSGLKQFKSEFDVSKKVESVRGVLANRTVRQTLHTEAKVLGGCASVKFFKWDGLK